MKQERHLDYGRMKIKISSRYMYQCSRYAYQSASQRAYKSVPVVAMRISPAVFQPFCSRYVYTYIIYQCRLINVQTATIPMK